eukprot:04138_5
MFASAFPFASLLAFINNMIEIRTDARKLCAFYQRPFYRRENDIGGYQVILEFISILSVITNSFILSFTSNLLEDLNLIQPNDLV